MITASEMYGYFLLAINKANQGTVSPPEFDVLITAAQRQWIMNSYELLERDQKRMDALRVLIPPPLVIANAGAQTSEQEVFQLPYTASPAPGQSHGYLFLLNAAVKLFKNGTQTPVECVSADGWVMARPLRRDAALEVRRRPFSRPTDARPRYMLQESVMRVKAGPGSYAGQARIEYIRHPKPISVVNGWQPELPPEVNQQVADLAVRHKLQVTADPRLMTRAQEDQLKA